MYLLLKLLFFLSIRFGCFWCDLCFTLSIFHYIVNLHFRPHKYIFYVIHFGWYIHKLLVSSSSEINAFSSFVYLHWVNSCIYMLLFFSFFFSFNFLTSFHTSYVVDLVLFFHEFCFKSFDVVAIICAACCMSLKIKKNISFFVIWLVCGQYRAHVCAHIHTPSSVRASIRVRIRVHTNACLLIYHSLRKLVIKLNDIEYNNKLFG